MYGAPPSMPWSNSIAWSPTANMIADANAARVENTRRRDAENMYALEKRRRDDMMKWMLQYGLVPNFNTTASSQPPTLTFEQNMGQSWANGSQGYLDYLKSASQTVADHLYNPINEVVAAAEAQYGPGRSPVTTAAAARGMSANSPALNYANRMQLAQLKSNMLGTGLEAANQTAGRHLDYNNQARLNQWQFERQAALDNNRTRAQIFASLMGGFQYSPLTGGAGWDEGGESQSGYQGFSGFDWDVNSDRRKNPQNYDSEQNPA